MRQAGTVDYAIPEEPISEAPIDQAQRYVDGTGLKRLYSSIRVVSLDDAQPEVETIVIEGDGKTVGLLHYERNDVLGWHLETTEACSPPRP